MAFAAGVKEEELFPWPNGKITLLLLGEPAGVWIRCHGNTDSRGVILVLLMIS